MQAEVTERKPRKSVQFSEGATIVDSNGDVTKSMELNGGKDSAEGHSSGGGEIACMGITEHGLTGRTVGEDKEVDEVTDMFADLAKKVWVYARWDVEHVTDAGTEEEEVDQEEGG